MAYRFAYRALALVLLLTAPARGGSAAGHVWFDDGREHTGAATNQEATVGDGPGGRPTLLTIPAAASYRSLALGGDSTAKLNGGQIEGDVWVVERSHFLAQGGTLGRHLIVSGNAACDIDAAKLNITRLSVTGHGVVALHGLTLPADCAIDGSADARLTMRDVDCLDTPWSSATQSLSLEGCRIGGPENCNLSRARAVSFHAVTIAKPQGRLSISAGANIAESSLQLSVLDVGGDAKVGVALLDRCQTTLGDLYIVGQELRVAGGSIGVKSIRIVDAGIADFTRAGNCDIQIVNLSGGEMRLAGRAPAVMALTATEALVDFRGVDGARQLVRSTGAPGDQLAFVDGVHTRAILANSATGLVGIPVPLSPPAPGGRKDLLTVVGWLIVPAALLGALLICRRRRSFGVVSLASLAACVSLGGLWQRSENHNDHWLGCHDDLVQIIRSQGGGIELWSSHKAARGTERRWGYGHGVRNPWDAKVTLPRPHWPHSIQEAILAPYWLLISIAGVPFAFRSVAVTRAAFRRRVGPGHCARCGYDVRATPERCPECGLEAEVAA